MFEELVGQAVAHYVDLSREEEQRVAMIFAESLVNAVRVVSHNRQTVDEFFIFVCRQRQKGDRVKAAFVLVF